MSAAKAPRYTNQTVSDRGCGLSTFAHLDTKHFHSFLMPCYLHLSGKLTTYPTTTLNMIKAYVTVSWHLKQKALVVKTSHL
jgi:hypothetical protein